MLVPLLRWAVRTVMVWVIEAIGLVGMSWLLPGVDVTNWAAAFLLIAVVGVINALLWPLLARLTLPFVVFTFGFFTLLLNGLIFYGAGALVSGVHFSNLAAATVAAIGVAAVNVVLSALFTMDEDASFYRNVIQRRIRPWLDSSPAPSYPGVIFLEIDGCGERVLRQAIASGYMPTVGRWLRTGSHRLVGWETDLSSQTSATQAGILHGRNGDIPAFRWVEKGEGNRIISSTGPRDAAWLEQRISTGDGLLAHNGASRGNLFSGDAPDAILTYSHITRLSKFYATSYYVFFANPYNMTRALVLYLVDVGQEIVAQWRQAWRHGRFWPDRRRMGIYPFARASTTVLLREMTVHTIMSDIFRGQADAIYATFVAYDEVAHYSGAFSPEALHVLHQLDHAFRRLERAAADARRPYQFVILSDHGQTEGASFRRRFGLDLSQLIDSLLPKPARIYDQLATNEDWAHVSALASDVAQHDTQLLGDVVRRTTRAYRSEGAVVLGPDYDRKLQEQAGLTLRASEAEVIVLASGNQGLVYFTAWPQRLTLETLEAAFPGLVQRLAQHPGIGFAAVLSEKYGPLAIGAKGVYYLDEERSEGENPLAPFGRHAARHVRRACRFSNAPDILVNSFYDPRRDEAAAFEEQASFHGGLGGDQTRPFIVYPRSWALERAAPIVGAEQVHRLFKQQIDGLAGRAPAHQQPQRGNEAAWQAIPTAQP